MSNGFERRLESLDGLRAVAILWVAIYHYAVFWAPAGRGDPLLPYGDALAWVPLARVGDLGVSLFFIVSGLVIALSLGRSSSGRDFAVRRAVRLWPTLLICGAATFAATTLLGPEALRRSVAEALISLTFLPPVHVGRALGADWGWLDGAYWSLWVEVRFYIVAALIYFLAPVSLMRGWAVFAALCAGVQALAVAGVAAADLPARLLFAEHQPWLTAGIALAALMRGEDRWLAWVLLASSAVLGPAWSLAAQGMDMDAVRLLAALTALGLASAAALRPGWVPALRWPPLTALGRASYGYYLLHQNLGLALLLAVPVTGLLSIPVMLAVQAGLIAAALALYRWVEVPLGRHARRRLLQERPAPRPGLTVSVGGR